jgi:hypothetical protein
MKEYLRGRKGSFFSQKVFGLTLLAVSWFFLATVFLSISSAQSPAVDLRDKKGVVAPKDLKKDDPKERSLKIREVPPPAVQKEREAETHKAHKHGSDEPGKASAAVPARPPASVVRPVMPPRPLPGR